LEGGRRFVGAVLPRHDESRHDGALMAPGSPIPTQDRYSMKLNDQQIAAVKASVNIDAVPADNPAVPQLAEAFGDHTFFVVTDGLFILEEVDRPELPGTPAEFILIAGWANEERNALQGVEPTRSNTIIDLDTPAAPGAA